MQHSPRTKGIIQHFERQVRLQVDALAEDVQVSNEHLGQLETTQLETGVTLRDMQAAHATTNTNLATIMTRLEELSQQLANVHHSELDEQAEIDYSGDNEHPNPNYNNDLDHRRRHANRQGMHHYHHRHAVHNQDDSFAKIKFTIPPFNGKYDPDAYLGWELVVDKKFACHAFFCT